MKKMILSIAAILVLLVWVVAAGCYLMRTPAEEKTKTAPERELPRWEQPELVPAPRAAGVLQYQETSADVLEEAVLNGTGLEGLGEAFVESGENYDIDPVLLVSICALESGWGKSELAKKKNNIAGICRETGEYERFLSRASCVRYLAWLLDTKYRKSGAYYGGGENVEDIAQHYNPEQKTEWAEQVKNIMGLVEEEMRWG